MIIVPCQSIHSFFMAFPIDVAFVDKSWRIIDIINAMPPWRASRHYFKARAVIELPAGTLAATGTQVGDLLDIDW